MNNRSWDQRDVTDRGTDRHLRADLKEQPLRVLTSNLPGLDSTLSLQERVRRIVRNDRVDWNVNSDVPFLELARPENDRIPVVDVSHGKGVSVRVLTHSAEFNDFDQPLAHASDSISCLSAV
jgi:hypothetical protein